jgi:hypothetical protein
MRKLLDKQERELQTTKEQLLAIRKFAVVYDSRDAQTLMQSFSDLNNQIDDFAFNLLMFRSDVLPTTCSREHLAQLLKDFHLSESSALGTFLKYVVERKGGTQDFIFFMSRAMLCEQLMTLVFHRFNPLIDEREDEILRQIHIRMLNSEPQEKLAQWRAIAYMHSSPSEEVKAKVIQDHSEEFIRVMATVFDALEPGATGTVQAIKKEYGDSILRIFRHAISLHQEIRTKHLLCDYSVICPGTGMPFDAETMKPEGDKPGSQAIFFTIALGMRSQKNILKDKDLREERSCVVKAVVLGDNWEPAT